MRIIGHRGTPTTDAYPENTLPALRAALQAGADGVEVDVRATRDGVLVLSHDPDLGRVLGLGFGAGPVVADSPWRHLRDLPLPHATTVPRLADAFDLVAAYGALVVTEVKADTEPLGLRSASLLAALLARRRASVVDRVTTSSFDLSVAGVLAGTGTVGGGVILEPSVDPYPAALRARAHGLTELHLSAEHVHADPTIVRRVHALGLSVAAGIVDDVEEARWLAHLGVDILCTDAPGALVPAMVRMSARPEAVLPTVGWTETRPATRRDGGLVRRARRL